MIRGGARFELPLSAVLGEARARFTLEGPAQHNLCISHRRRVQLNKAANERERKAHPGAQLVRARQVLLGLAWADALWGRGQPHDP